MNHFELNSDMTTMGGVFYPTGHVVLMFPSEQDARDAEHKLEEKITRLTPAIIQGQIARTIGTDDSPLPSAGTEADTVRRFAELASQGHHGLMINAPDGDETAHIMEVLKGCSIAYAQKYRSLVIEDLG
jgi:hypothetical protein